MHNVKVSKVSVVHAFVLLALFQMAVILTSQKVKLPSNYDVSPPNISIATTLQSDSEHSSLQLESPTTLKADKDVLQDGSHTHPKIVELVNHHGKNGESICEALHQGFGSKDKKGVLYKRSGCEDSSLGNRLIRVYTAWLLTASIGAQFSFSCQGREAKNSNERTITAQLQHLHKTPSAEMDKLVDTTSVPPIGHLCQVEQPFLDPMVDLIRHDFRTMAAQDTHVHPTDVAIHYRCGDALVTSNGQYGVLPHSAYHNVLSREYNASDSFSVSIVTQPFDPAYLRKRDQASGARCKLLVEDLISALNQKFPYAKMTVYNDFEKETVARTYARLVKTTRATICGPSTFCALPTLSSLGTGYVYNSTLFPFQHEPHGVRLFSSPKLRGDKAKQKSDAELLKWLREH